MRKPWTIAFAGLLIMTPHIAPAWASNAPSSQLEKSPAPSQEEREIRTLLGRWMEALVKNDLDFRDRIMADDETFTTYDGAVITKSHILEAAKFPNYAIEAVNPEDIKVRVYGDAAVVNLRVSITERMNGKSLTNRLQVTQTWIKTNRRWQVVAEHATRIVQ